MTLTLSELQPETQHTLKGRAMPHTPLPGGGGVGRHLVIIIMFVPFSKNCFVDSQGPLHQ